MLHNGAVVQLNPFVSFNNYIKNYSETDFAQHYSLFEWQTGVYRFNLDGKPHYIGYSQNLFDRVRTSFFNHCLMFDDITFQYILCDSKEEAMDIESYYIYHLQPSVNYSGRHRNSSKTKNPPEFCRPMQIHFNEFFNQKS
jgi:hypothetical protein